MNDFLQSLRGVPKDKRPQKTRRGFDNNTHYNQTPGYPSQGGGYQNTRGNVKRVPTRSSSKFPGQEPHYPQQEPPFGLQQEQPAVPGLSMDAVERALDILDEFLKNQERLVDIQQRRIMAEERKADSLEEIARHLREGQPVQVPVSSAAEIKATEPDIPPQMPVANSEEASPGNEMPNAESPSSFEATPPPAPPVQRHPVRRVRSHGDVPKPDAQLRDDLGDRVHRSSGSHWSKTEGFPSLQDGNLFSGQTPSIRRPVFGNTMDDDAGANPEAPSKPVRKRLAKPSPNKEIKVIKRPRTAKRKVARPAVDPIVTPDALPDKRPAAGELLSRDEVMEIIESMRSKGATFDQVAKYLVEIGQPTFSGRGEWHAQTVHRLCNRKK